MVRASERPGPRESAQSDSRRPERRRKLQRNPATVIPHEDLVSAAFKQFDRRLKPNGGDISAGELRVFVRERVSGIHINGVDVISIDIGEHNDAPVSPVARAYLESARTKTVVAEYFEPELRRHGVYAFLSPIKTARNYGRSILGKPEIPYQYKSTIFQQLGTASETTRVLAEIGKPVAVADIANRFEWMAAYGSLYMAQVLGLAALFGIPPVVATSGAGGAKLTEWLAEVGMYNTKKVTKWDKFVVDFDQARRLYLAKGVEMLTRQLPKDGQETPQVIVLYPRAHTLRMEDTLLHPHQFVNTLKSAFYKTWAPYLNFSLRQWSYRKEGVNERGKKIKAKWIRTGRKRITV